MVASQSVLITLILCVIAAVIGVFFFKGIVNKWEGRGYLAATLTSVQIELLNLAYSYLSRWLNNLENHPTETSYENSLILKNFMFKFINEFNTLFYIAFLKRHDNLTETATDGCLDGDCLG